MQTTPLEVYNGFSISCAIESQPLEWLVIVEIAKPLAEAGEEICCRFVDSCSMFDNGAFNFGYEMLGRAKQLIDAEGDRW